MMKMKNMTSILICSIGLFFIFCGFIMSPLFVTNYLSPDGIITVATVKLIQIFRLGMIISGVSITFFGIFCKKIQMTISGYLGKNIPFNYEHIFILPLVFFAIIIVSNLITKFINRFVEFDCPYYWPISVFSLQIPDLNHLFTAIAIFITFYFVIKYAPKIKYEILYIIFVSIVLVMGTNLIQGYENGFLTPIAGGGDDGIQYYHDAIKIIDASYFLFHFENIQSDLLTHSKTHPPGAVLIIYFLLEMFGNPAFISIVIGIISISLSAFFLYKILSTEFDENLSRYLTFLFLLIPSIQIYYIATIDALISSFLLAFLYYYLKPRSFINIVSSIIFLFLSSFISFTFFFILPIIAGYEILIRKHFWRLGFTILSLGFIYIIINILFNYNYVNSFIIASALENPHGFRLFSEPVSYIFTRVEGIFEIILFFGPFLSYLTIHGLYNVKKIKSNLLTTTWLAILTLLMMFATGAFRTGETARAAIYIYPYLIFPIALYWQNSSFTQKDRSTLLYLVFAQTVLMQLFGTYFW